MADFLSIARFVLAPVILWAAFLGQSRWVGFGLILAGLTDFFDGYVARRYAQASAHGASLDATADLVLLLSAAACLEILHPEILEQRAFLVAATATVFGGACAFSLVRSRRLPSFRLFSSKVAGGLLYLFAVDTFLANAFEPVLLVLAAGALIVSSLESVLVQLSFPKRAETMTSQATGSASRQRSHPPHAEKEVGSSARAITSSVTSPPPIASDIRP